MDHQALKKVIKHSVITAVVGDTIGTALDTIPLAYHSKVFRETAKQTKSVFPPCNGDIGKYSQLSTVLVEVLNLFIANKITATTVPKIKLNLKGLSAESLALALAIVTGYYAALSEYPYNDWMEFTLAVEAAFAIEPEYCQAFIVLNYLTYNLVNEGYLRASIIQKAITYGVLSGELQSTLDYIATHQFNKPFMSANILDHTLTCNLNHVERVIAKSVFYMFQTFTGWKTKPRFLLDDIVAHETDSLADILFVFGALCTVSEHQYLLFTKPLQEQIRYNSKISDMFMNR